MKVDNILKKINKYKYITFDIFDTLILRDVSKPCLVFEKMQKDYNLEDHKFCENRISAERNARKESNEVTLELIYQKYENKTQFSKDELKNYELETEFKVCKVNYEMLVVLNKCIELNKKIYLISDMYLSHEMLQKILENCGIKGYEKIYVSCEYNSTKSSGELYEIFCEKEKINFDDMMHIGDNVKSDYMIPKLKGIDAFLYKKTNKNKKLNSSEVLKVFLHVYKKKLYWENFGFENFGPLLYGYIDWLTKEIKKDGIGKVYFFSREGQIIKKAFDWMNKKKGYNIKTYYLNVSRRSLVIPACSKILNKEELFQLYPINSNTRVIDYIKKLGLDEKKYETDLNKNGIYLYQYFFDLKENNLDDFIKIIWKDFLVLANDELLNIKKYLDSKEVKGTFAIVDVGWNGSMQRALDIVLTNLNISHNMTGYYLSQREGFKYNSLYIANKPFLYKYNDLEKNLMLLNSGCSLIEMLFCADHGTTLGYDDYGKPIFDSFEFDEDYPKIKIMQESAMQFVEKFYDLNNGQFDLSSKDAFCNLKKILMKPKIKDVTMLGDIHFSDTKNSYLAPRCSYGISMKKEFIEATWKVGFLKRNFKVPLPYFKLYVILRKLFN